MMPEYCEHNRVPPKCWECQCDRAVKAEARVAELEGEKIDARKYLETVIGHGQRSATRVAELEDGIRDLGIQRPGAAMPVNTVALNAHPVASHEHGTISLWKVYDEKLLQMSRSRFFSFLCDFNDLACICGKDKCGDLRFRTMGI